MAGNRAAKNAGEQDIWDRKGRSSFSSITAHEGAYAISVETTQKGIHPPRSRIIVECVKGRERGEECTVENTPDGLLITNQNFFSSLNEQSQDMVSGFALVMQMGMVRGWNACLPYGYEKGMAAEKERAAKERDAKGKATRKIFDEVRKEAAETGKSRSEVAGEHLKRVIQKREAGNETGAQR